VRAYVSREGKNYFNPQPDDAYALITTRDGRICKHEFYYGSTYLSQSSRSLALPEDAVSVTVFNSRGKSRKNSQPIQ
jgi:hypothetical protein